MSDSEEIATLKQKIASIREACVQAADCIEERLTVYDDNPRERVTCLDCRGEFQGTMSTGHKPDCSGLALIAKLREFAEET